MNNRVLIALSSITIGAFFVSSCGDTSTFETPNTSATLANDGLISQKNFTILFSETKPKFLDLTTGEEPAPVTSEISVQIGDNKNQLITGSHTIHFKTEWGLIDPGSCTTADGGCSVTWSSGSFNDMPANYLNNILAYSVNGQETFEDIDGNGFFNDGDTFEDLVEPFIDANESGSFDAGDFVVDTINGIDPGGKNALHDAIDGLYNGPNCTHSSLCSTSLITSVVWESGSLDLTGGTIGSGGGGGGDFSRISLSSDIPAEILIPSTTTMQRFDVDNAVLMGDTTAQIAYTATGNTDGITNLYKAEAIGQTELASDTTFATTYGMYMSDDSTKIFHDVSGASKFITTIAGPATIQIGAAEFSNPLHSAISADGSLVAFVSTVDITGGNPGNFPQIFTLTTDGTDIFTQITSFAAGFFFATEDQLLFSGDGNTIFFHSNFDVLVDGSNADGSDEIFSIDTDGTNLTQYTDLDLTGNIEELKLDSAATTVLFLHNDLINELYTVDTATKAETLLTTLINTWGDRNFPATRALSQFDISADGSTVIYVTSEITTFPEFENKIYSINPDGTNKTELFSSGLLTSPNNAMIQSIHTNTDGSATVFISDFDYGKTAAGVNEKQIYTLN